RLAGVGITREDRRRPFVVARTQIRVPDTGIAGAVEEESGPGVVGDPTPAGRPPQLPLLRRPRRDPQVLALIFRVKGPEPRPDFHVAVRAGVVGAPQLLAAVNVETGHIASHAHFAARVADDDVVLQHDAGR